MRDLDPSLTPMEWAQAALVVAALIPGIAVLGGWVAPGMPWLAQGGVVLLMLALSRHNVNKAKEKLWRTMQEAASVRSASGPTPPARPAGPRTSTSTTPVSIIVLQRKDDGRPN